MNYGKALGLGLIKKDIELHGEDFTVFVSDNDGTYMVEYAFLINVDITDFLSERTIEQLLEKFLEPPKPRTDFS